jgi:hypothetical protein
VIGLRPFSRRKHRNGLRTLNATAGVQSLLLTGVERVALVANVDRQGFAKVERVSNLLPQLQVTAMLGILDGYQLS